MKNMKDFIQKELSNLVFRTVEFDEKIISTKMLDSINLVDLIVSIEEHLEINIPTADVTESNFDTIYLMCEYLEKLSENG